MRVPRSGVAIVTGAAVAIGLAGAGFAITGRSPVSTSAASTLTSNTPTASGTPEPAATTQPTETATPNAAATTSQPTPSQGKTLSPVQPAALLRAGDRGAKVRGLEARLVQLELLGQHYVDDRFGSTTGSAVRAFQARHGLPVLGYVDQSTWDRLVAVTRAPTQAELHPKPAADAGVALDPRCVEGRVLCIDKTARKLRYVLDGRVVMTTDVRFGAKATRTREGLFHIGWKSRNHHSKLFDTDMPFAMFFSGGQAVHYSPDFAARGYDGASHGCVNVRNRTKVAWLFDQVHVGDRVVIYWS